MRGVSWDERVRRQVMAGATDVSLALMPHEPWLIGATAYFQNLPSAGHTYMLTLGASADINRVRVRVGNDFLERSQLVASPEGSEIRALFTYEAGGHGKRLMVLLQYLTGGERESPICFHHIQLAQPD